MTEMMFGERKYKLIVLVLVLICIFALQGCKKSKINNKSELSKSEISSQTSFTEGSDLSESALNSVENSADKDNWKTSSENKNNNGEEDTSTVSKTFTSSESKYDEESSDEFDSKATIVSDKDVFR